MVSGVGGVGGVLTSLLAFAEWLSAAQRVDAEDQRFVS